MFLHFLILAHLRSSTSHLAEKTWALALTLSWSCRRTSLCVRRRICGCCGGSTLLLCRRRPGRCDRRARSATATTRSSLTRHIGFVELIDVKVEYTLDVLMENKSMEEERRTKLSLARHLTPRYIHLRYPGTFHKLKNAAKIKNLVCEYVRFSMLCNFVINWSKSSSNATYTFHGMSGYLLVSMCNNPAGKRQNDAIESSHTLLISDMIAI